MLESNPREALDRTPAIRELWDRMLKLSHEYYGYILVADTPFFINASGRLHDGPLVNAHLTPTWMYNGNHRLWSELLTISNLIREGFLDEESLSILERWCTNMPEAIEGITSRFEIEYVQFLKQHNALH